MLPDASVYAFYLILAIWACSRLWTNPYRQISGHLPTDNIQFFWWLSHAARSVVHWDNPFFAPDLNVPMGVNLMANTSVLGVAIPLTPITLLFGPQVSYIIYLTLALAGSAAACYYVFSRYLVKSRLAAAIGAAFFGFAPGIIHHASGQPNFVSNFLLPFIVLRVFRLREPGRMLRNSVVLGLLVTWQIFINEETLLLAALGTIFAVLLHALMRPREVRGYALRFVAAGSLAVAVALPLLAYPLWFQFRGPQHYHGIQVVFSDWGEDVTAYFTFARDTLAGNAAVEKTIGLTEQNSWFGAPLMVLILIMVVLMWRRSLAARITTITGVFFAVLAAGPTIRLNGQKTTFSGPWQLMQSFPLVKFMYPSRMVYVVIACVAVLLALACDALPKLSISRSVVPFKLAWGLAVAMALVPILPKPMPATTAPDVPAFITQEQWRPYVDRNHSLVTVPPANNTVGLKSVLWHAVSLQDYNMPRGYFLGPDSKGVGLFGAPGRKTSELLYRIASTGQVPPITDQMKLDAVTDLRFWRAALLVLDTNDPHESLLWQVTTTLTGVQPTYAGGVWLWDVREIVDGTGR
jgi:hypothetical protein